MICKICGKEFTKGFGSHITRTHNFVNGKEYYDTYLKTSQDGKCKLCGKPTKFVNILVGYRPFCSQKCAANDPQNKMAKISTLKNKTEEEKKQIRSKIQKTKLEKYGDPFYNNKEKIKQTFLNKYGSTSYLNSDEWANKKTDVFTEKYGVPYYFESEEFKKKAKQTKLEKYGDENYNNRVKSKETCLKKYDFDHPLKNPDIRKKVQRTCMEKEGVLWTSQLSTAKLRVSNTKKDSKSNFEKENDCTSVLTLVKEYGQGWYKAHIVNDYLVDKNKYSYVKNIEIKKIINYASVIHYSNFENEVLDYVKSIYFDNIRNNVRDIIKPLELDIYIPNKNLAIECNGIHWHSVNAGTDKNYHKNKTDLCAKKDIRLIHIFQDEWYDKQEICKSIISSALGIYDKTIYARNCDTKEVDSKLAKQFLDKNHIQGSVNSSYRLGLFYNNELVQLITIGKSRFKKDEYELLRMCTKLNTQVVGGFSKLMKYQPYNEVVSFIDKSLFTGKSYFKIGWELIEDIEPGYFYYRYDTKRLNRLQCQKHKLQKLLGNNFDSCLTESENMLANKFYKLYNSGNIKVRYKR